MPVPNADRRVVLLETDERPGLVAALTVVCSQAGISLEITTGPEHVLMTFAADDADISHLRADLAAVPGVQNVYFYRVVAPHARRTASASL
jgi:hypothetical protein